MDYREYAKDLLARKKHLIAARVAIRCELNTLDQEKTSCKGLINECEVLGKDKTFYEDRLINTLANLDDCRFRMSVVERELKKIEKGMDGLDDYERDLLELFFVERSQTAADDLMDRWFKERSSLYRDKNRALDSFTRSIYGVLQL